MKMLNEFLRKIRDPILYEVGRYWVMRDSGIFKVFAPVGTATECVATYPETFEGMTLAMAYADYRAEEDFGAEKYYRSRTSN